MDNVKFAQKCIIENEEGKILILKRSNYKNNYTDYKWDFPGGTVELGEDCRESIKRECLEEAKIKLNSFKPIIVYSRPIPNRYFFIFSLCISKDWELIENKICLSHEHIEYKWIDKKEFLNYDIINSIDYIKEDLKKIFNI